MQVTKTMSLQLKQQSQVFNPDGTMTNEGKRACEIMKINPDQLKLVTEQQLLNQGVPAHIATVQLEHHEEKRAQRIEMLENTIRSGMLNQLQNVLSVVESKDQEFAQKKIFEGINNNYQPSDSLVDIPLREPLEPEFRLNRKLAKQIYNKEKLNAVIFQKEAIGDYEKQMIEVKAKKEKKADKAKDVAKRAKQAETMLKFSNYDAKGNGVRTKNITEQKIIDQERRERAIEIDELYKEKKRVMAEKQLEKEKLNFIKDQEAHKRKMNKQDAEAEKMRQEEQEIQRKLQDFNIKIAQKQENKVLNVKNVQMQAREYNRRAKSKTEAVQAIEHYLDLEKHFGTFSRIQKCEKIKKENINVKLSYLNKREEKVVIAKTSIKIKKDEAKEYVDHLKERQTQIGTLIREVKSAFREEQDQKKEINLLKKKDQLENFERGKNFHSLYRQKLVERLLEKKERAARVKSQTNRIGKMMQTQRVRVDRSMSQDMQMNMTFQNKAAQKMEKTK